MTGNENHDIDLPTAATLTRNYRIANPSGPFGGAFGKDALLAILNQQGCTGIRYYYAIKDDGTPTLVLTGVDSNSNDLADGVLAEYSYPSPPYSSAPNSLNS
jgi:hypothetical protein